MTPFTANHIIWLSYLKATPKVTRRLPPPISASPTDARFLTAEFGVWCIRAMAIESRAREGDFDGVADCFRTEEPLLGFQRSIHLPCRNSALYGIIYTIYRRINNT